jgi:hypothetical protein
MSRTKDDEYSDKEVQERFEAALRGARISGHKPMESLTRKKAKGQSKKAKSEHKVCPECSHVFQGDGWDGIDAHWRAKHDNLMPYEKAWPLIKSGKYNR